MGGGIQEVDFLRKPWYSGAVVAGGVWAKSREGAYELWDTFKPGGRLTPESLFESQVWLDQSSSRSTATSRSAGLGRSAQIYPRLCRAEPG